MLAGSLKECPHVAAAVRLVFDQLVTFSTTNSTVLVPAGSGSVRMKYNEIKVLLSEVGHSDKWEISVWTTKCG